MTVQTLIAGKKLSSLLALLAGVSRIEGAIAELGVYQGGSLKAMAEACPAKTCYGFDTFTGLPIAAWQPGDFHMPGEFAADFDEVARAMPPNVRLVSGLFPFSASDIDERFCFAHVDFDLERSTSDAIAWLKPRMVSGGLIVFDDWDWENCPGVSKAIGRAAMLVIESAPNQCYWRAP